MNKSIILTNANKIRKQCGSLSLAFKKAWKAAFIAKELKKGEYNFSYIKKNGELREADGTTNENLFEYERKTDRKPYVGILTYFDLDKDEFRSARISNLIL